MVHEAIERDLCGYTALSIRQPSAELIARGKKRFEERTWRPRHRGPLVIVSSSQPCRCGDPLCEDRYKRERDVMPLGVTVCLVDLVKVTGDEGDWRLHLANPRRLVAKPVKGKIMTYTIPSSIVVLDAFDRGPR
jgi:hypothetical protein